MSRRGLCAAAIASLLLALLAASASAQESAAPLAGGPPTQVVAADEPVQPPSDTASPAVAPEAAAVVAVPDEVPPPPATVLQASDDERPPVAHGIAEQPRARRRARAAPPPPVTPAEALASPVPPPPDPYEGRRYPVEVARRPLTLTEGVWRLDHVVDWNVLAFAAEAPNTLTAGLTNDVEIGVAWPWTRDPTVFGTVRVFGSEVIDVGVRASARIPAITTGDTVVRAGVPIVIRPTSFLRIATALEIDLLLTSQISPWAIVPLQLTANVTPRFFLGAQGSAGWLDGERWTGQVGVFIGHTVSATRTGHPIFEIRWTTSYMIELNDLHITAALSFFPRFW